MTTTDEPNDYPFYRDGGLRWLDWTVVLVALVIGYMALTGSLARPAFLGRQAYGLLTAVLFSAIPLAAFAWRAGRRWTAIFNGFRWSYIWWGIAFGVLNLVFTFVISRIALELMDLSRNSAVAGLAGGEAPGGAVMFYLRTGIQLFGEEVITILPFLFLLWLGVQQLKLSRTTALLVAWLGSALLFAAIHLPTYQWNVAQALLLIGPVRLVLTLAYMKTRSIWTSTVAHVFNDWSMFTLTLLLSAIGVSTS